VSRTGPVAGGPAQQRGPRSAGAAGRHGRAAHSCPSARLWQTRACLANGRAGPGRTGCSARRRAPGSSGSGTAARSINTSLTAPPSGPALAAPAQRLQRWRARGAVRVQGEQVRRARRASAGPARARVPGRAWSGGRAERAPLAAPVRALPGPQPRGLAAVQTAALQGPARLAAGRCPGSARRPGSPGAP